MKIAIPAEGNESPARTSPVLGRCPYFVFVDTETEAQTTHANPGLEARGGAGVEATRYLVKAGVEVVLSQEVGPKARAALDAAGVRVLIHECDTVAEALHTFREDARP